LQSLIVQILFFGFLAVKVWAVVDCATRRPELFPAAERRTKNFWLIITGLSAVTALVTSPIGIFGLAGIVGSLVYLLDVRPRVAEVQEWMRR